MLTDAGMPPAGAGVGDTVPDVSIVIVSWNGKHHLDRCLRAVAAQRHIRAETILVDNGSSDGTARYVRAAFPWVRLVELPTNEGFAGGNNAGVRVARGGFVALLNNDTEADPDWLVHLMQGVDVAAGFALVSSRVVFMDDPDIIDSAGDGLTRAGGAFKRGHGMAVSASGGSCEVFGVCGAACLMPTMVFRELGGFDDAFFVSHEDVDLSYRARLLGYRCRYVADAVVLHRGSATLGRMSAYAVYQGQRNLEWVYLKNTPRSLLLRTLLGHLVYNATAAIHFARLGLFLTFVRAKWAAVAGLPRVWRQRAEVKRTASASAPKALWAVMEPRWLVLKLREKRFDRSVRGAEDASPHA
jgi:GT2 family glycosyltransferase